MIAVRGHDANIAALRAAAASGKLHHAWLLAGPPGVGKATFAESAARWLLASAADPGLAGFAVPDTHSTAHLIAAGSHPDFIRLQRLEREKGGTAQIITIDQVRALGPRFATAPSFSARRVVIIDAIDDLERPGANALLKNLEEPPAGTIFLCVSHAPGRLLPTIRSRCRILRFGRLGAEDMAAVLRAHLPEAPDAEIAALAAVGEGAPGQALRFAGLDIGGLDAALAVLAREGDPTNARRSALARSLASKAAQPRYEAFLARVPSRIAAEARRLTGQKLADAVAAWDRARRLSVAASALNLDPQATTFELAGMVAELAPRAGSSKA